jgi:glycosyltransferase involved in cell wall biosynthesis
LNAAPSVPFLSVIIPAHNEAFTLAQTLSALNTALSTIDRSSEVIVVNDASTDRTAAIAHEGGARVIDVNLRQIASVRNAGARVARGELFLFVDADTQVPPETLRAALAAVDSGAIGGGAQVHYDQKVGRFFHAVIVVFNAIYTGLLRWAAGCFIFARRGPFQAVGGFDETLFASEEVTLSRALKKQGSFVIVRPPVITSSRKIRTHSLWWPMIMLARMAVKGPKILRQREGLELWYDGKRVDENVR